MFDIDKLVEREAPKDDEHDKEYAKELRSAYERLKDHSFSDLKVEQRIYNRNYRFHGATHHNTATLMVIYELLKTVRKENEL